ncbi:MAG: hypothetical protein WAS21_09140 [Geminicoccaceae bacterium]
MYNTTRRRVVLGFLLGGAAAIAAGAAGGTGTMAEDSRLARDWVEVREEADGDRLVFRPAGYPVPPTRGGRQHLQLAPSGEIRSLAQGPADAMETKGSGSWSRDGDVLRLKLKGWEGEYVIEELGNDRLELRRR